MTAHTLTAPDGQHVAWDSAGDPERATVVLLHALGTDRTIWDELTARLALAQHVVRIDLRGHGASTPFTGASVVANLGHDVVAVLDALAVERAHVAGVSLGGLVAQWLGVHEPTRLRTLTLANTAARIGTATLWDARIAAVAAGGLAAVADASAARWFSDGFRTARPARVDACRARLLAMPADSYLAACVVLRDTDLGADVGRITVPTMVIGGRADVATTPADSEALAAAIPGAALEVLEAGHLSNVECPEEFHAALSAAIAREVRHG